MSLVGDAIDEARALVSAEAADILPDRCTITVPGGATRDAFDEEVAGSPTTTADVPCEYTPLSAYERSVADTVMGGADFKLKFPVYWDGVALNVPKNATAAVEARGLNPAQTFTIKGPLPSSTSVWLYVAATLKQ